MTKRTRQRICIVSLTHIAGDARVLRQVKYLHPHYDISVIGYGDAPPQWLDKVDWHNIRGGKLSQRIELLLRMAIVFIGRFFPFALPLEFTIIPSMRQAKISVLGTNADVYHANDWDTLPLVLPIAKQLGAQVVFDAHEYSPEQQESAVRKFFVASRATYFLKRYAHEADRMITVSPLLAEKYMEVFNLEAQVIMNAPQHAELIPSPVDADAIHLVHHGIAVPRRHLELMIETMGHLDARYHLHLYLVSGRFQTYVDELKSLAQSIAPHHIHFNEPILPDEITHTINQHDVGFYILKPFPFNHFAALPNKFFEFINASLALCISPTPGMATLAHQYDFSVISETYEPQEIAQKLNSVTPERIMEMKYNAYEASKTLNADVEMAKVVQIYHELFSE